MLTLKSLLVEHGEATPVMRALHVLTLTPFYPTDNDDSRGAFVLDPLVWLAKKQAARNTVFAVQPIYRGFSRSDHVEIPAQWFRYLALPGGFGLPTSGAFAFARIIQRLRELQRTQPVDLIHAHGALPCGHAAMLISHELKIPFVVSVHGLDVFSTVQVGGRSGIWCRRISQRVYSASRRVICISERVREQVLEGAGRNCRTSVVYNGVDPVRFSPADSPSSDPPFVLAVGNLLPIKGHGVLVRAFAAIASEFPSVRLEIMGHGTEQTTLELLAREFRISDRIRFLGRRPRQEVTLAMRRCTLFALPSRYEGLGCVYLEAMATGKPVIGCRGQGIAEIVQQGYNGFLVGPDNEKELALVMGMLLRDEQCRLNLGIAARNTILESLTLEQQAEKLARIYRECIG